MAHQSIRNFSILGLLLLSVSAITAAIVPAQKNPLQTNSLNNGTLRQFSGGDGAIVKVLSCVTAMVAANCHKTDLSGTTGDDNDTVQVNALGHVLTTRGNTSLSRVNIGGDTTSILVVI